MHAQHSRPAARDDLVHIWQHTFEHWGVQQADSYLDKLETSLNQLSSYLVLGMDHDHVLPDIRCLYSGQHAVYYKLQSGAITIIRVLHQSMDAPRHLPA